MNCVSWCIVSSPEMLKENREIIVLVRNSDEDELFFVGL